MENSSLIHPTAVIHPEAIIKKNVHVGAYSVIGKGVKLESGCVIGNHVTISGDTFIDEETRIYHSASVGEDPQDKKYDGEDTKLYIGKRNLIREFCTINKGTAQDNGETVIGDDNWIMAYCHIAHDCRIGNQVILANNTTLGGHAEIDDCAVLGGATLVHQFCKIGSHVMTAGGSGIQKDVPPFVITHGNFAAPVGINSEGLKRRGFNKEQLSAIKRGYKIIYRQKNSIDQALVELKKLAIEENIVNLYIDFISRSKRGLIR